MLNIFRKGVCALAVATSFMATSAQAGNHSVLIMDGGYFPSVVYISPGDGIIFTNKSDAPHTLSGPEESWVSDPIQVDATFILEITDVTPDTFSGLDSIGEIVQGSFTYDPPPASN